MFIGDTSSARCKLAKYYLREFTEISLFSSDERVQLQHLYVAMKWTQYSKVKINPLRKFFSQKSYIQDDTILQEEMLITDYKEIFKKV